MIEQAEIFQLIVETYTEWNSEDIFVIVSNHPQQFNWGNNFTEAILDQAQLDRVTRPEDNSGLGHKDQFSLVYLCSDPNNYEVSHRKAMINFFKS